MGDRRGQTPHDLALGLGLTVLVFGAVIAGVPGILGPSGPTPQSHAEAQRAMDAVLSAVNTSSLTIEWARVRELVHSGPQALGVSSDQRVRIALETLATGRVIEAVGERSIRPVERTTRLVRTVDAERCLPACRLVVEVSNS